MVRFKAEGEDGETSDVATVDVASLRPATQGEVTVVTFICACVFDLFICGGLSSVAS